jgi:hypothetical protein
LPVKKAERFGCNREVDPVTRLEISHVYEGLVMVVIGATALWAARRPASRARFAWPVMGIILAFILFLPAESPMTTHERAGWAQTLRDVFRVNWTAWFASLQHPEVVVHKIGSALIVGGCLVELARGGGTLQGSAYGAALPLVLTAIALLMTLGHASSGHAAAGVQLHHWVLGACLIAGAALLAIHRVGAARQASARDAWAILLMVAGLDWALLLPLTV